jgi:biofilm PGA synthesis N-glycosyltransferase PgaC
VKLLRVSIKRSYWVIVTTRNRHDDLKRTLDSLLDQTVSPSRIVVFDDGSTPAVTYSHPSLTILRREDEGYDIRRVVKNWNMCLDFAVRSSVINETGFLMISADDCVYPPSYVGSIIDRMINDNVAVASGSRGVRVAPDGWKPPEGSGRLVANLFLESVEFRLPERAGYEPWIFYEALRRGLKVACYEDVPYTHLQKFGGQHQFVEWARMAHTLGYDPLFFIARCIKNMFTGDVPRRDTIRVMLGYMKTSIFKPQDEFYEPFSMEFRRFVRNLQRQRLTNLFQRVLGLEKSSGAKR